MTDAGPPNECVACGAPFAASGDACSPPCADFLAEHGPRLAREAALDALDAGGTVTIGGRAVVVAWWPERIACYADTRELVPEADWPRAHISHPEPPEEP